MDEGADMKKIVIGVKYPKQPWEAREVEDTLPVYQKIVGGYIEGCFTTQSGIHIFGNEEARILKLPPNVMTPDGMICGPVFAVRSNDEGEFVSLTLKDMKSLGMKNGA